jgi:hypothetical protein
VKRIGACARNRLCQTGQFKRSVNTLGVLDKEDEGHTDVVLRSEEICELLGPLTV